MNCSNSKQSGILAIVGLVSIFMVTGCLSSKYPDPPSTHTGLPEKITLQEGDVVKIIFPDAPNLNATVKIKRDGSITLESIGDILAVGMTAAELEKALLAKYADKIISKEINVIIESSNFQIYITGAVMHPGKVVSDRPLTALEAVLEAGGVDYSRANLKGVMITRKTKGRIEHFKVDVQSMISGKSTDSFDLRPNDILFVPEKFSWF